MRRQQAGDTIVEVLIAMAVISLVLGGAYTAVNRNIRNTLDAQEHAQALKLVESQIEFLRAAVYADATFTLDAAAQHCFDTSGNVQNTAAHCQLQANGSVNSGQQPNYNMNISKPSIATGPYTITTTWDTPAGATANDGNITMFYRP